MIPITLYINPYNRFNKWKARYSNVPYAYHKMYDTLHFETYIMLHKKILISRMISHNLAEG